MENKRPIPTIEEINVAVAIGKMFIVQISPESQKVYDVDPVHETMVPLVEAIDETGLVKVINNCPGHFDDDIEFHDQDHAGALIGFLVRQGVDHSSVDRGFAAFTGHFDPDTYPVYMRFVKQFYSPDEYRYYIELIPSDNDMLAFEKRLNVDAAVAKLAVLVKDWTNFSEKNANTGETTGDSAEE